MPDTTGDDREAPEHWHSELVAHHGTINPDLTLGIAGVAIAVGVAIAAGIGVGWIHPVTIAVLATAPLAALAALVSWFVAPSDVTVAYLYDPAHPDDGILETRRDPPRGLIWLASHTGRPPPAPTIDRRHHRT